jgi:hypothetical protein
MIVGGIFNYSYYNVIAWGKGNAGYEQFPRNILECDVIDMDYEYLLFLKYDNRTSYTIPDLDDLLASLNILYTKRESPFIVLTPRKIAPLETASEDEFVYSFSCKIELYNKLIKNSIFKNRVSSTQLLFELLDQFITKDIEHEEILVRQIPIFNDEVGLPVKGDVIIPHRGDNDFLQKVLLTLSHIEGLCIFVGIDQEISERLQQIIDQFPAVHFYSFSPNPVGPYVIRNRLIERSSGDLQFFHDSDDISCRDRFEKISRFLADNNCDWCGSHELRLNYYKRTIRAVRFPENVNQALGSGPWFALLHPTSAILRKPFFDCGKLSEERTFGNDTKFLLNSFFYLQHISNVDEFLYIRRIHPGSLTTMGETKLGSPVRRALLYRWNSDFESIKMGNKSLVDSSLVFYPTSIEVKVCKVVGRLTNDE